MSDLDKPIEILDGHPARVLSPADLIEAQAARIERLDARIEELKAEAKLWWDENFKKQTACEQMGKRIAELEAALQFATEYVGRLAVTLAEKHYPDQRFELLPDLFCRIDQIDNMTCGLIRAKLAEGKKDE